MVTCCDQTLQHLQPDAMREVGITCGSATHLRLLNMLQSEGVICATMPPHDHIVHFLGVTLDADGLLEFLVFERLVPVDAYVASMGRGTVDITTILDWMADAARGLAHLHAGGSAPVLHRDLKADNVMVRASDSDAAGARAALVVTDFSEAIVLEDGDGYAADAGNRFSKAPEVLTDKRYTTAAEVYALGIVFVELVARYLPGDVDIDVANIYGSGVRGVVNAAVARLAGVNTNVAALVRQCCSESAVDRPSSVHVATALSMVRHRAAVVFAMHCSTFVVKTRWARRGLLAGGCDTAPCPSVTLFLHFFRAFSRPVRG